MSEMPLEKNGALQENAMQSSVGENTAQSAPQSPPGMPTGWNTVPPQYVPPAPKPFLADRKEWILLFFALLLGILAREWIFMPAGVGVSTVLFLLAFYGVVFFYGHGDREFQPKRGILWGVPVALGALSCLLFSNPVLSVLNVLFLYLAAALHVWTMFGQRSLEIFSDLGFSAVCAPFAGMDAPFRTLARAQKISGGKGKVGKVLLGLLIAAPVVAIVTALLVSADGAFESLLEGIFSRFSEVLLQIGGDLFVGAFLAIFIFSWLYTARRKTRVEQKVKREMPKVFDSTVVGTVICAVCAVYVVFLVVQFNYLFSAVWGSLPTDQIYSSYARRGFFEMLWIAGINLLILVFALCSKQRDKLLPKIAGAVLSGLTVILALSALCKMGMYVRAYGLTPLRIYTSWFLILEIAVFVILTVGMFWRRLPTAKVLMVSGMALYLALNFVSVDAMIATHNTNRYFADPENHSVDVRLLGELGYEAVPSLIRIQEESDDPVLVEGAEEELYRMHEFLQARDWRAQNVATLSVRKALAENVKQYEDRFPAP